MSKADSERLRNLKNDYRAVFMGRSTSKQGQRVLQDLLQLCGIMSISYIPDSTDQTAYNEGQRKIGLDILNLLDMRGYEALHELERQNIGVTEIYADPYETKGETR